MIPMAGFKRLTSPIKIANMELRNCMIMPPMVTNFAYEDGSVTDTFRAYHEARPLPEDVLLTLLKA